MTETAKKIKEKLDVINIPRDTLDEILKDRLDFGFDSIYFRYAAMCDELAAYKAMYDRGRSPIEHHRDMNCHKMHFYEALEQLVHAHEEERKKYGINK